MCDHYRGTTVTRLKYGSSCLHSNWRPKKVHKRQREHKLPLLQWGNISFVCMKHCQSNFQICFYVDNNLLVRGKQKNSEEKPIESLTLLSNYYYLRSVKCFFFSFYLFLQYFVFDFHMAPAMLFDKIITLSVSMFGIL